jgi:hypothetical protein
MSVKGRVWIIFIFLAGISLTYYMGFTDKRIPAAMPTTVDVNGVNWKIQQVANIGGPMSDLAGVTECSTKRIFISNGSMRKQTALMHELSHAAVCIDAGGGFMVNNLYYNSLTNLDHEGIYRFSEIWAELLIRNPQLALYESGQ